LGGSVSPLIRRLGVRINLPAIQFSTRKQAALQQCPAIDAGRVGDLSTAADVKTFQALRQFAGSAAER
jgi:hypothetical protein